MITSEDIIAMSEDIIRKYSYKWKSKYKDVFVNEYILEREFNINFSSKDGLYVCFSYKGSQSFTADEKSDLSFYSRYKGDRELLAEGLVVYLLMYIRRLEEKIDRYYDGIRDMQKECDDYKHQRHERKDNGTYRQAARNN